MTAVSRNRRVTVSFVEIRRIWRSWSQKISPKAETGMSSACFFIPLLAEATEDLAQKHDLHKREDEVNLSFLYEKGINSIHLAGKFTPHDNFGTQGCGAVTLTFNGDIYIYVGRWQGGKMAVHEFIGPDYNIRHNKLWIRGESPVPLEIGADDYLVVKDEAFVVCRGSNFTVELPLLPNQCCRMVAPDGDYVELNVESSGSNEGRIAMDGCPIPVYRISRSFETRNEKFAHIHGFLDVWGRTAQINWHTEAAYEDEQDIDRDLFFNWLLLDVNGKSKAEHRNLLRALKVKPPLLGKSVAAAPVVAAPVAAAAAVPVVAQDRIASVILGNQGDTGSVKPACSIPSKSLAALPEIGVARVVHTHDGKKIDLSQMNLSSEQLASLLNVLCVKKD